MWGLMAATGALNRASMQMQTTSVSHVRRAGVGLAEELEKHRADEA